MDDEYFMNIALEEAQKAFDRGDLPVGAVLTIDRELYATGGNTQVSGSNLSLHAESSMIIQHSPEIRKARKTKRVELYSTLEPCIMCFGTAVQNGIHRIVYACPDPFGGATDIVNPSREWVRNRIPTVEGELFRERSYDLLVKYMSGKEVWKNVLRAFKEMGREHRI